jgi:hypothetical protein
MRKLLGLMEELEERQKRLAKKYQLQERRNTFRTILEPSSSLYFDIAFSREVCRAGEGSGLIPSVPSKSKTEMEARPDSLDLAGSVKLLALPNRAIAMRFFKYNKNIDKNLYLVNMESFETLVIEGGREIDYQFYLDKEPFSLKMAISYFNQTPKFGVLVLSYRNFYVELLGATKGFKFDGYGGMLTRDQEGAVLHSAAAVHHQGGGGPHAGPEELLIIREDAEALRGQDDRLQEQEEPGTDIDRGAGIAVRPAGAVPRLFLMSHRSLDVIKPAALKPKV